MASGEYLAEHMKRPRVLRWREMQPNYGHSLSHEFGPDFTIFQPVFTTSCRAAMIRLGPGKTWPPHSYPNEHLLVMVDGHLRWLVMGKEYELERYDMLFVPAGAEYSMTNASDADAMYLSLHLKARDDWPQGQSIFPPYDSPPTD